MDKAEQIKMEKSICFFSSYFSANTIPYYIQYYLDELNRHFSKIIFLCNEHELDKSSLDFLKTSQIELKTVTNEGFDFGMWYKAFQDYPIDDYKTIALINDSCILFRKIDDVFQKIRNSKAEYIGMIQSDRYHPHIQSFFLVLKGKAINLAKEYFSINGIEKEYRKVIHTYEIGLSGFMIENGVQIEGLYNKGFEKYEKNPSFARVYELIAEGMPLIKKKIVFRNYRGLEYYWILRMNVETDYRKYVELIDHQYGKDQIIDFNKVMLDAPRKNTYDMLLLSSGRKMINLIRKIPFARSLFRIMLNTIKKWRK